MREFYLFLLVLEAQVIVCSNSYLCLKPVGLLGFPNFCQGNLVFLHWASLLKIFLLKIMWLSGDKFG